MLKQVYDPTAKQNPMDSKAVNEKIKNGDVKVKSRRAKREETTAAKTTEPKQEEAPKYDFLAALKEIGHPATSREISDKVGISDPDKGRAIVRREMEKLIVEKKVEAVKSEKKNVGKLYKLPA